MPTQVPKSDAERQRRSKALRDKGGVVASARLTKDHQDMMEADGWLDTSEADAVRDNERLRGRLYREACGVAIGRILDWLLQKPHA